MRFRACTLPSMLLATMSSAAENDATFAAYAYIGTARRYVHAATHRISAMMTADDSGWPETGRDTGEKHN